MGDVEAFASFSTVFFAVVEVIVTLFVFVNGTREGPHPYLTR